AGPLLLPTRHVSAVDADYAVRARERGGPRVPPRRPRRRNDARGPRQCDLAPALLHLRNRVPFLGFRVCRGADDGAAGPPGSGGAGPVLVPRAQGALPMTDAYATRGAARALETAGAWLLGIL